MPTRNRRLLAEQAVKYWRKQTWHELELVIIDASETPIAVPENLPARRVLYERVQANTPIGSMRNVGCEIAQGDIVIHLDDDDWYASTYVERIVHALLDSDIAGISKFYSYAFLSKTGARSSFWDGTDLPGGACVGYHRRVWREHSFEPISHGEDSAFFLAHTATKLTALSDPSQFIYMRHMRNVTGALAVRHDPHDTKAIRCLLGPALSFYDGLAELLPNQGQPSHLWHCPPMPGPTFHR